MTHDRSDAGAEYERLIKLRDRRREIGAAQTRARAARKRAEREASLVEHNRYVAELKADRTLRGTVVELLWTR